VNPSPVVALNRAVAIAMAAGSSAAWSWWMSWTLGVSSKAITSCLRRGPSYCAGWIAAARRPTPIAAR
jgi:hypothetical protein